MIFSLLLAFLGTLHILFALSIFFNPHDTLTLLNLIPERFESLKTIDLPTNIVWLQLSSALFLLQGILAWMSGIFVKRISYFFLYLLTLLFAAGVLSHAYIHGEKYFFCILGALLNLFLVVLASWARWSVFSKKRKELNSAKISKNEEPTFESKNATQSIP